ncbi:preprotein translocase subunit TatB [Dehalobacter sp. MCB1]|nr:preprotein translocase subunit TatB [Dehalobacter sp. MCB1]TCX53851.1 preprotein translocase subunit TatB [Dehalobacter sp. 14DCB1]
MDMLDARGRSCPEPVIMIKKAMASNEDEYAILLDNRTSLENVSRFARVAGYHSDYTEENGIFTLKITKK